MRIYKDMLGFRRLFMTRNEPAPKKNHGGPRKGAGRPPSPDTQPLIAKTERMTAAEWEHAAQVAQAQGVSVNELVRRLVRAA